MFQSLPTAPTDPILGLTETFRKDPNPSKINLSVGVYVDETGTSPIFGAIKEAEKRLLAEEKSKGYLGMAGSPEYAKAVEQLLFGEGHPILRDGRARTAQTPGGTGALRVAGDFLRQAAPSAKLWMSKPTWANHAQVFKAAGFELKDYPYYDAAKHGLNIDGMVAALAQIPEGDIVLLHGCCHNPTGVDPTTDNWRRIAATIARRKLIPLVDLAYQGFARGLSEDVEGLLALCEDIPELVICTSYSKNFGLYNERVGALALVAENSDAADKAFGHVKMAIRANYSNPPAHGGLAVKIVLADKTLRGQWECELAGIRNRMQSMRGRFVQTLREKGIEGDFSFMERQYGMFSLLGISKEQVETLKREHGIYLVDSGRINVAGLTSDNLGRVGDAFAQVLSGAPAK